MIKLLFILSSLFFSFSSVANDFDANVKTCLASLYTAQRAHFYEYGAYTSNINRLGLSKELCPEIKEYEFVYAERNHFEVIAIGHDDSVLGQVNSMKEINIY